MRAWLLFGRLLSAETNNISRLATFLYNSKQSASFRFHFRQEGYVFVDVCLFVSRITPKLLNRCFLYKFCWKDDTWSRE